MLLAGIVVLFSLARSGVAVVGEIPRGLPSLALPDFSGIELAALVPAAVGVAVGFPTTCSRPERPRPNGTR